MSSRTRGVAVAVRAMIGTLGKSTLRRFSSLYAGPREWHHNQKCGGAYFKFDRTKVMTPLAQNVSLIDDETSKLATIV